MDDKQKLIAFAKEVVEARRLQKHYFKTAALSRKGEAGRDEVERALAASKKQESIVDRLTNKVLAMQNEIPGI